MGKVRRRGSFAVALSGLAIGWIAGLSVSPVVSSILAALLGIGVAVVAALAGVRTSRPQARTDEENANSKTFDPTAVVDPVPIAVFTVFVAIGASFGLYARSNYWLAPSPFEAVVNQWISLGKTHDEAVNALFDKWKRAERWQLPEGGPGFYGSKFNVPPINREDDGADKSQQR
jgi:hypothetical protein